MLSTKDIKTGGGGTPKTLQPGNLKVKINAITLEEFKFKPGALNLVLHLEGESQGDDFEGFWINKDDESLGRHKGQVGKVRASEWAYVDGETKSGIKINRDTEILKFIKNLCTEIGMDTWLDSQDGKHKTINSLVEKFNDDKVFKDKWLNICLAAKEYLNKEGYTSYDLFLPKYSKTGVPFESAIKPQTKLTKFKEADHIRKKKEENLPDFGSSDDSTGGFKL